MPEPQYSFDLTDPGPPPRQPAKAPAAPSKPNYNFDLSGDAVAPAAPVGGANMPTPEPINNDDPKRKSGSIFGDGTRILDFVKRLTPDKSYAAALTRELIGGGGQELVDAATSPAGLGIIAAHVLPPMIPGGEIVTPFVFMGDAAMGWYQGVRTVPSVIDAARDPGDPAKMARAIKDTLYSYGLIKGGLKGMEGTKVGETKPRQERALEAIQKLDESAPLKGTGKKIDKLNEIRRQQRAGVWKSIEPQSLSEKAALKVYQTPGVRQFSAMLGVPKPTVIEVAQRVVNDRLNLMNEENTNASRMKQTLEMHVPKEDLAVNKLGYVIQGDATPEEVGLGPQAVKALDDIIHPFQRAEAKLLRTAHGEDVPLQEDVDKYLSQIWNMEDMYQKLGKDPAKVKAAQDASRFVGRKIMRDPYLKGRKIHGYQEGMEVGLLDPETEEPILGVDGEPVKLIPKYNKVADIMYNRHLVAAQTAANRITANRLADIGAIMTPQEARRLGVDHWPEARDSSALYKATYAGSRKATRPEKFDPETGQKIRNEKEFRTVTLKDSPVKVNPLMKMAVDSMFAHGVEGTALKPTYAALEQTTAFTKTMGVLWSFFHNNALSEQRQAILTTRKPLQAVTSMFFFDPVWYRGLKATTYKVLGQPATDMPPHLMRAPEEINAMLRRGLELTSTDSESTFIKNMRRAGLDEVSKFNKVPGGKQAAWALRRLGDISHVMSSSLWDYYFPNAMVGAFETIKADMMNDLGENANPKDVQLAEEAIASHVNKVMGAESMDRMMLHPMFRQALRTILFAPVWSLSNIRVLTSGFENDSGKKLTARWAAGGAISWLIGTELLNYAMSSWYGGTDREGNYHEPKSPGWFTWDNPGAPMTVDDSALLNIGPSGPRQMGEMTENFMNVYMGVDNKTGQQRYFKLGKNYREPFMWMLHPYDTFASKLSRPVRAATDVAEIARDRTTSSSEKRAQATFKVLEMFTPFAGDEGLRKIQRMLYPDITPDYGTSTMPLVGLPETKGLTYTHALEAYTEAKRMDRDDLADKVMTAAEINNISTTAIARGYQQNIRKRRRTERGPTGNYDSSGRDVETEVPPQ